MRQDRSGRIGPRATAALVVALAFVVGGLAGASLLRAFEHHDREGGPRFVPGMKFATAPVEEAEEGQQPGQASERMRARFAKALDLTPAQGAAVDSISLHEFEAVSAVRAETWPRMQAVLDDTRLRIDSILTPEQRARYHDMLAKQAEHWREEQTGHDSAGKDTQAPRKP
jgi:Spy/CpxP family protein refolding chaperone